MAPSVLARIVIRGFCGRHGASAICIALNPQIVALASQSLHWRVQRPADGCVEMYAAVWWFQRSVQAVPSLQLHDPTLATEPHAGHRTVNHASPCTGRAEVQSEVSGTRNVRLLTLGKGAPWPSAPLCLTAARWLHRPLWPLRSRFS